MADDIVMYVFWSVTGFVSLRKRPFLLALRRLGRFVSFRNVPSGEERGETDVFAGYGFVCEKKKISKADIINSL